MTPPRLTRSQAVALYDSGFWRYLNAEERACFQLCEERLCMPFAVFHESVEICLNRRVAAGEYLRPARLLKEIGVSGGAPPIDCLLRHLPPAQRFLLAA